LLGHEVACVRVNLLARHRRLSSLHHNRATRYDREHSLSKSPGPKLIRSTAARCRDAAPLAYARSRIECGSASAPETSSAQIASRVSLMTIVTFMAPELLFFPTVTGDSSRVAEDSQYDRTGNMKFL
jgi:hypothetical protein